MKRIVLFLVCYITIFSVSANDLKVDTVVEKSTVQIVLGEKGDEVDVESAFKNNIPKDKTVAGLPHFAIVGKHKLFYLGLGANFKALASFDYGNELPSELDFVPSQILPSTPGNGANFRFSAQASSIYLNFIAMPNNPNKTGLFFSGDFKGENYGFKLSHFYIKYRGLKLGYSHSAYTDNDAVPFTIDEQGACGQSSVKMVMAMWTQSFGKGFYGTLGIDAPKINIESNDSFELVNQRLPSVPMWIQFKKDLGHIRLSGLLRPMQYRDKSLNRNQTYLGWGIQLSGMYNIVKPVNLYYGANYGKGISSYVQDCSGLNVDLVYSDECQKMEATPVWSCHLGAECQINQKFVTNVLYSRVNTMYDDFISTNGDMVKSTQYFAANLVYKIKSFAKVGIEYKWGYRKNVFGNEESVNRIQCLFSVEI